MMSSSARRSQPRGRGSRERILACAVDLFARHGFEAMTMRQLGEAAGLDNSSLYRHFPSKAALVDAVLDRVAADVFSTVAPRFDPSIPPSLQILEDICAVAGLHLFDHPAAARLIVHWLMSTGDAGPGLKVAVPASDTSRPAGKLVAHLLSWIAHGVKKGALRKHAKLETLVVLFGALLLRPATYGHLLVSFEPRRSRAAARKAWERELRAAVRGVFTP